MSKVTMALAFGAGYVVGARAGRERYREIKNRATAVWQSDTVQEQTSKAQDLAKEQAVKAKDAARDRLPSKLGGRADDSPSSTSRPGEPSGAVDPRAANGSRDLGSVSTPGPHP